MAPGGRLDAVAPTLACGAPEFQASAKPLLRRACSLDPRKAAHAQYPPKGSAQLLVRHPPDRGAERRTEAIPPSRSADRPLSRRKGRAGRARGPLLPPHGQIVERLDQGRPYRLRLSRLGVRPHRQAREHSAVPVRTGRAQRAGQDRSSPRSATAMSGSASASRCSTFPTSRRTATRPFAASISSTTSGAARPCG